MSEKKVLVVDDEEKIRDIFEQAFSKAGYIVRLAESAEEALEILKDDKIQVMFLDFSLMFHDVKSPTRPTLISQEVGVSLTLTQRDRACLVLA